jgi:ribonuclease J
MTPGRHDLWFLPLGGTGEIGINMNLYGHDGQWLMVDCGVGFDRRPGGTDVIAADAAFIAARRQQLAGLLVTHAHEDHVGAVAYHWPELRCPVYCTPFTAAILQRKLAEVRLRDAVPLHVVAPGTELQLGRFSIEWLDITHSIPESQSLVLRTQAGSVFHSGDWKLDEDPVVGAVYDRARLQALAREDILAMVCDSTNATLQGHSHSEGELRNALQAVVEGAPGRVVVACFGSNIARLHTLATIAADTGRYPGLIGRSLQNYYRAALATGIWTSPVAFIEPAHLGFLPPAEVLAVATGSQGETGAALGRLAAGSHPHLEMEPGDTLVMSSRVIPGNEEAVERVLERLRAGGVKVVLNDGEAGIIHASGHPASEELLEMYRWVQPAMVIPVHGEARHMRANAALARAAGVPRQLTGTNGDLFMLAPVPGIRRHAVPVGRVIVREGGRE